MAGRETSGGGFCSKTVRGGRGGAMTGLAWWRNVEEGAVARRERGGGKRNFRKEGFKF